jgi:hypothetical protein
MRVQAYHRYIVQSRNTYIENEIYGNNYPRPLSKLLEGEEVYKVETILKHWKRKRISILREMERISHY